MTLFNSPEFKVGLLVVAVSALIGVMSLRVSEGPGMFGGARSYSFMLDDAGGLVENSAVKMAGIKVGVIESIDLADGRARVQILLEDDVPLTTSGEVELKSDGILGDRHVEVHPGDPSDPRLPPGSQIRIVDETGSLNRLMSEVGDIAASLKELAKTLRNATEGEGDVSTPIGRIVINLERLTRDLADVTGENKEKINHIVDRVSEVSGRLERLLADDNVDRVDETLRNLENITAKINEGEGTIGKLINDEKTIDEINTAVTRLNGFLGTADQIETSIDFHSEYLANMGLTKSYLGVKIQPGLDRFYEIQVIDDPLGLERRYETTVGPPGGPMTTTEETRVFRNEVKFTALFAKNFYDLTVKGGMIQNSGGIAFDYHMFRRRLQLSMELFDFEESYMRAFARYNLFRGVYLVGGGDNILNDELASTFFGAGIFLTNDDLKIFASRISF